MLMESDLSPRVEPRGVSSFESLGDLVLGQPRGRASEEAFVFLGRHGEVEARVSYQELANLAITAAAAIQSFAEPGEVIVLAGLEGSAFIEAFFGCILAGAIPAPLPRPRHPRDQSGLRRLQRVAAVTKAVSVISQPATRELLRGAGREIWQSPAVLRTPEEIRRREGPAWVPVPRDADQAAYLQFTSGSTAEPRGVVLTHGNVLANLAYMHAAFAHEETLRVAGWLPLHHDMGLAGHVLLPLYESGFSALMSPAAFLRDPGIWLRAFRRFGANGCAAPPFALELCVRRRVFDDPALDLSGWKYAYIGSEVVTPSVLDLFAGAFAGRGFQRDTLRPCYGLAEATVFVAGATGCRAKAPGSGPSRERRAMIGYPTDPKFVEVLIIDPATGSARPDGEPGEIWISGESVASAYRTAKGLEPSGSPLRDREGMWVSTGDWGLMEEGALFITGRTKNLVIIHGANIASEELEQTVRASHPALAPGDATACFAADRPAGETLVVAQEVKRGLPPETLEEIRASIVAALLDAHDASPSQVLLVPSGTLPRTANGKISRSECRKQFGAHTEEEPASSAPPVAQSAPANSADHDPVVIIGIACRFPGADDSEEFWKLLSEGRDAISEVPPERWDNRLFYDARPAVPGKLNTKWGGFLTDIDQFDPGFFGISAKEAAEVDPQQRLLMETAWRLFENAGLKLETMEQSETGVFVGISTNDYLYTKIKLTPGMETFDAYSGLGNANSIAANRLSYLFDLRGPSVAVDTACSSSLTAFHLAVESVRAGDCAMAIAGGANAILSPGPSITLSQFGMMAPDGRCKVFDARADGYVRAEGCGLVLLKRRSAALRDGNNILACVRATAIGQDGRTPGITLPNGAAQMDLLKKAVSKAGIHPGEVGYAEAHGTGTSAGDPIEVAQLKAIYGAGENAAPCYLGSVKANIGHLEAAAGIASVIKTVLVLQHRQIPPQIHVRNINPQIDLAGSRLAIPGKLTPWENAGPHLAAVSSFGFGGANAHAILEEAGPPRQSPVLHGEGPFTFVLSGKTQDALRRLALEWIDWLAAHPGATLAAICGEQTASRSLFSVQEKWLVSSRAELLGRLQSIAASRNGSSQAHSAKSTDAAKTVTRPNGSQGDLGERLHVPGHPFFRQRYWMQNATPEHLARFASPLVPAPPAAAASAPVPATTARTWNYGLEWIARPFRQEGEIMEAGAAAGVANWIIVGAGAGLARSLAEILRADRHPVFWIGQDSADVPGARSYEAGEGCDQAAYGEILGRILNLAAQEGARNWRILYLAGMDSEEAKKTTGASLDRDQDLHGPGDLLRLTRAVIDTGRILQMWIVTSHAQNVQAADWQESADAIQLAQAPLWGFGRTLFLEHPELRGGLVDVNPSDPKAAARQILRQASDPEVEHSVAFRDGRRYIAQLAPLIPPASPFAGRVRSTGAFIITGGLGGLGLRCARWLAERGARDIVLIGRRRFPARNDWKLIPEDDPNRATVDAILKLESLSARVETAALDVRDSAALRTLFGGIRQSGRPIRGVIHAAGVNWFGKIRQLDVADFLETMKIKVSAAWTLHELTREDDLDCFLLFSSVSALWGSVDLSHYTAANHFLDALSIHRAALKLPALSINWGPWAETGMSAKAHEAEVLDKLGLRLMPPQRALQAMQQFEAEHRPGGVVADIDWKKFQPFIDFCLSPSLFGQVATAPSAHPPKSGAAGAAETSLGNADDPLALLEETVRKALGSVMMVELAGKVELDQRFNLIGMDSLMSIAFAAELERTLNLKLPNTLAYNYPTLRAVRDHLYTLLLAENRVKPMAEGALEISSMVSVEADPSDSHFFLHPPSAGSGRPRIYCFPGAGSGASSYAPWVPAAASWAGIVRVQFPGREELAQSPPLRSIQDLAATLANHLADDSAPFAFYGYSLGALAAFELSRELRRRGRPGPAHLFLAGCGLPVAEDNKSLHLLPDELFLDALSDHVGVDQLQRDTRDIAQAILPLLRADIEMIESFQLPDEPPLACPITVFVGEQDPLTPRPAVMRWHAMTTGDFTLRRFSGGHDFPKLQQSQLLAAIHDLFPPSSSQ